MYYHSIPSVKTVLCLRYHVTNGLYIIYYLPWSLLYVYIVCVCCVLSSVRMRLVCART